MLYLSQILNSKIKDSSDKTIGRLKDISVKSKAGAYAPLDFLIVKGKRRKEYVIPYEFVENLSKEEITLKSLFKSIPNESLPESHAYLNRDVLDQQIVDLEGARVVRVNDLKLGLFEDRMSVLGIDISNKGLLRRLGLERFDFLDLLKVSFIDWRKAQPIKGILKLDTMSKDLTKLHPADLANIVEDLSLKQGSKLVRTLDAEMAAKVFEEIEPAVKKILVSYLGPEKASQIVEKMSADEIADLLQSLPREERDRFLSLLQNGKLKKVERLIKYRKDTAGGLMNMDYMSAGQDWTVAHTLDEIRRVYPSMRSVLYVYVIGKREVLKGTVSLRRLISAKSNVKLKDIMKRMQKRAVIRPNQSIEDIVSVMTKYNLYTAAVADEKNTMIGMVAIDDVMRCLAPKA